MERELVKLRPETRKFKSVAESAFALHGPSGPLTLRFHLLHTFMEDLETLGSFVGLPGNER